MKILFVGDYSGFHHTLARQLRALGHECVVASDGSRCMDTTRDVDITRRPGLLNSFTYVGKLVNLFSRFKGYDIVQLINPGFVHLKPEKQRYFFNKLKRSNGKVGLTLAGTDSLYASALMNTDIFRYSEYRVGNALTPYAEAHADVINRWLSAELTEYCKFIYDNVDGAVSALYEYHEAAKPHIAGKPLVYAGIPIDTDNLSFKPIGAGNGRKINILAGIKSEMTLFKGTDRMLAAAREVERLHPDVCRVSEAKDLPLNDYLQRLEEADIVLDQLYSYTPATNALQTMAMGKIAVSGAEPEYYRFIGEEEMRPIVNAVPDDRALVRQLEELVTMPIEDIRKMSVTGRAFVEKHNSSAVVAQRFLKAWEQMMK